MSKFRKPRSSKSLAVLCARIAEEKLAKKILLLNLKKIDFAPTDFFVICSCDSDVQARAIADEIRKQVNEFNLDLPRFEGMDAAQWVLIDFFDVVVHIMLEKTRSYYKLEKLWGDAEFLMLQAEGTPRKMRMNNIEMFYEQE